MYLLLHTFLETRLRAGVEDLIAILPTGSRILIIGVGNEYGSDDAVGLVVARRLRELALDNVSVIEQSGEGASLMESWRGADSVILIDAASSGVKPGKIHRLDAKAGRISRDLLRCSTHAFSVGEAIELARTLNQLPPRFVIFCVEAKSFEAGTGLSLEVEKAAQEVVELVVQEIRTFA